MDNTHGNTLCVTGPVYEISHEANKTKPEEDTNEKQPPHKISFMSQFKNSLVFLTCLFFTLGCGTGGKKVIEKQYSKVDVPTYLPGNWIYLGFDLKPGATDTLYTEYPNKPGMEDHVVYGIKTDSGTFRHTYSKNSLLHIKADPELELVNFSISINSVGTHNQFTFKAGNNLKESMNFGFGQAFKWLDRPNGTYLRFFDADGTVNTVPVQRLDSDWLELDWGNNKIERFKRAPTELQPSGQPE